MVILLLLIGVYIYIQGTLPDALKCRDIILDDIVSKLNENNASAPPIAEEVSHDYDEGDIVYNSDKGREDGEKKSEENMMINGMDEYFDMTLISTLSNLYNIRIVNDDNNIDYAILSSLITDIQRDGHKSANAADYLLETEYLSTTNKLNDYWIGYRDKKYPNFTSKVAESLSKNMNFENRVCCCNCDINNFFGCDVSQYCKDFCIGDVYTHGWYAFVGLSSRTIRYYIRKWWIILINLVISVAAAAVLGSIYGEMGETDQDIQNRFGALGFMCIFLGIQAIASSGTFQEIRDVFIDDRNAKLYTATPFLLARIIPDLILLRVIPSICFAIIFFNMLGFQEHTYQEFLIVTVLLACASSLCVFAVSSLMPDSYIAGFVAIFLNMIFLLYGGIFIQDESQIPWYVAWPAHFSFYNFAFEILMVNEFIGLDFKISSAEVNIGGTKLEFDSDSLDVRISGEFFVTALFGMDPSQLQYDWAMLITWIAIYLLVAFLALELLYRSKR